MDCSLTTELMIYLFIFTPWMKSFFDFHKPLFLSSRLAEYVNILAQVKFLKSKKKTIYARIIMKWRF